MRSVAIVGRGDDRGLSTDQTRLSYEHVSASAAWYSLNDGRDEKAREMVAGIADHLPAALAECQARLVPAPAERVAIKLTALLTLCAGSGFSEDDRLAWLAAALDATRGIPTDILEMAFRATRAKVDHPSKIIPALNDAFRAPWQARRAALSRVQRLIDLATDGNDSAAQADGISPEEVFTANRLMRRFKLNTRYRPDGTAFQLAAGALDPADLGTDVVENDIGSPQ